MNVIRMPLSEKPIGLTLEAQLTDNTSALVMVFSAALGPDPWIGAKASSTQAGREVGQPRAMPPERGRIAILGDAGLRQKIADLPQRLSDTGRIGARAIQ
jgi:hypothetical protein